MPTTSSFHISVPSSTPNDTDTTLDTSDATADDFSPIMYPADLLRDNGNDPVVPFVGFYVLLPQNSKAYQDENATLADAFSDNYLKLRGLDYASEVNQKFELKAGADLTDKDPTQQALKQAQAFYDSFTSQRIRIYRRVNLLKKFICLYMPETLNNDMAAAYNNLSVGRALVKFGSIAQIAKDFWQNGWQNGKSLGVMDGGNMTNFIASMSEQGGLFGALGTAARFVQAGEGTAVNPLSEQFFENMQFRQFTMDFKFVARNSKEADAILEIIKTFRMYMVPEIKKDSVAGLFMSVPAFFQIKYYIMRDGGEVTENDKIPKVSGCVLTGVTIDNAPEGIAFHDDGMPVVIRMQLYFTELEIMHRDRIKQGY